MHSAHQTPRLLMSVLFIVLPWSLAHSQQVFELSVNKQEYFVGEPILVRTEVAGPYKTPSGYAMSWSRGFTFRLKRDRRDYPDFPKVQNIDGSGRMLGSGGFPASLEKGKHLYRIEMLVLKQPGDYQLQASYTSHIDQAKLWSNDATFRVMAVDQKDSITKVVDPELLYNLGLTIFHKRYRDGQYATYRIGIAGSRELPDIETLTPLIMEKCQDSVFYPYVKYAFVLTHGMSKRIDLLDGSVKYADQASARQLAEDTIREQPDFWLTPDLYRVLFEMYAKAGEREKARHIGLEALSKYPECTIIRNAGIDHWIGRINSSAPSKN